MVRFKNRHLLVEFISPSNLKTNLQPNPTPQVNEPSNSAGGVGDIDSENEDDLPILPSIPFMVPLPDQSISLKLGDESGSVIFRAIRTNVVDVFGDEGWGRLASSFKGRLTSPLLILLHIITSSVTNVREESRG